MKPVGELTKAHLEYFRHLDPEPRTFGAPDGMEGRVRPVQVVVTKSDPEPDGQPFANPHNVVRVPWVLTEDDLVNLAAGGTIWLSSRGGLLPHMLEVQPPPGGGRS